MFLSLPKMNAVVWLRSEVVWNRGTPKGWSSDPACTGGLRVHHLQVTLTRASLFSGMDVEATRSKCETNVNPWLLSVLIDR
jgi:hypothetical protein